MNIFCYEIFYVIGYGIYFTFDIQDVATEQEAMIELNEGESYSEDFALSLLENAWNDKNHFTKLSTER